MSELILSKKAQRIIDKAKIPPKPKPVLISQIISIICAVLFVLSIVMCVVDFISYSVVTATVVEVRIEPDKNGNIAGYRNTYLFSFEGESHTIASSYIVKDQYKSGDTIKIYVKHAGDKYIVMDSYKTSPTLLGIVISLLVAIMLSNIVYIYINKKYTKVAKYSDN